LDSKNKKKNKRLSLKDKKDCIPVTGASMSIIVFSDLRRAAPSLMILSATFSSILPSSMKCCFKISVRGLFVLASNTSAIVSLCDGGNGTPFERD